MRSLVFAFFLLASGVGMATDGGDLRIGDIGAYAALVARPNPKGYMVAPIPSLVSVLIAAEQRKGSPLSEVEVLSIRDNAGSMVLPDKGELLVEDRGYADIDPNRCWQEWSEFRAKSLH
jgi:hypothetical protein